MRIRCGNVAHCNCEINFKQHFVHLEGRHFCSSDCALEYIDANRKLARAADPFRNDVFTSNRDFGDENDYRPQAPPEHV